MTEKSTRDNIVEAAHQLFYEKGFDHTSFADIADAVNISRGNFYYHFKTKDDILKAVIDQRMAATRDMLDAWEKEGNTPKERIRCFIEIMINNRAKIKKHGCPVGTLTSELAKLGHPALGEANEIFTVFRDWLRRQFEQMGRTKDADELALHVLAGSQGIATLASAFRDDKFIKREVEALGDWLDAVASETDA
ncbi:MAG: TetR/AcrR family transcriptional regulator [Rhodospirillales bacterium]|nr:TetR/AcrR family transcriptional regulator [Rhodospirillales bacterium]MBO6787173.1 TetR/AcrR family transcriptional regulator [Rhodospirillales bacterium]